MFLIFSRNGIAANFAVFLKRNEKTLTSGVGVGCGGVGERRRGIEGWGKEREREGERGGGGGGEGGIRECGAR